MSITSSVFVLDTNIFVEAYKRYYAFDIAPSFWRITKKQAELARIISIDRVKHEIDAYGEDDQLKNWVNDEFYQWFKPTAVDSVINAYRQVMMWSTSHAQFTTAAKAEFANIADSWLVAYALANHYILVTHEVYDPGIRKRIPIPNACPHFDVEHIDTFEMLRRLNASIG